MSVFASGMSNINVAAEKKFSYIYFHIRYVIKQSK